MYEDIVEILNFTEMIYHLPLLAEGDSAIQTRVKKAYKLRIPPEKSKTVKARNGMRF